MGESKKINKNKNWILITDRYWESLKCWNRYFFLILSNSSKIKSHTSLKQLKKTLLQLIGIIKDLSAENDHLRVNSNVRLSARASMLYVHDTSLGRQPVPVEYFCIFGCYAQACLFTGFVFQTHSPQTYGTQLGDCAWHLPTELSHSKCDMPCEDTKSLFVYHFTHYFINAVSNQLNV